MHLIVGVDAGINAAYAALDLNGRLAGVGCEKEASPEKLVERIRRLGVPSLIACDVRKTPFFVSKIAARFNVRVAAPSRNMGTDEKRGIGSGLQDAHMRDAYAAAVKAYRRYANRFRQIDRLCPPDAPDADRIKHRRIQGHAVTRLLREERQGAGRSSKRHR